MSADPAERAALEVTRNLRELIVDSFAGGGGASLGIEMGLGRSPHIAINHDAAAIAMHAANHPRTTHYTEDVWKVSPRLVTRGRPVGLLWASPDCKHFSRAKGSKPVEKKIRSLAWVVVKWAAEAKPRIIILENVREFADWGPLVPRWRCTECDWTGTEGQATLERFTQRCPRCDSFELRVTADLVPDRKKKGLTFRRFVGRLKALGYRVEWNVLNAADYGAPTHRVRLFLVARRDKAPIVWPTPSHAAPPKAGTPDLFNGARKPWRTAAECIDWALPCPSIFTRKRPLAEKTMRRIALGIKRYVLENKQPFIVTCNHGGEHFRGQTCDAPFCTFAAARDAHGLVTPILSKYHSGKDKTGDRCKPVDEPINTLDTQPRYALVAPILAGMGGSEYAGKPRDPSRPAGTILPDNRTGLVAAFMAKHYGGRVGVPIDTPVPTTTARGTQNQIVAANLVHMNHGGKQASGMDETMRTAMSGGTHAALVYSFLVKYFGTSVGQLVDAPLGTATAKDRFGLVTLDVDGETYVIVDIGMRMLTPRELARGQGFPGSYKLTGTKTSQVARIGNSVVPQVAAALAGANFGPQRLQRARKRARAAA